MKLKVISTGSKGNAYILQSDDGCLLLDAGMPYGEIVRALGHTTKALHAALVTHSHMDHAKAMPNLLAAGIKTCATVATAKAVLGESMPYALMTVNARQKFQIEKWDILPFETEHDAEGSVGYFLSRCVFGKQRILYLTDSYFCRYKFPGLTHIVIECNHIGEIIDQRKADGIVAADQYIRLKKSHFSLDRVLSYLRTLDLKKCIKIVLVHLSNENSSEAKMVHEIKKQTGIETVAARDGMTIDFDMCPF